MTFRKRTDVGIMARPDETMKVLAMSDSQIRKE
jgi:hypothetical protein